MKTSKKYPILVIIYAWIMLIFSALLFWNAILDGDYTLAFINFLLTGGLPLIIVIDATI